MMTARASRPISLLDELGFEPCREERCAIEELHPVHAVSASVIESDGYATRGRPPSQCRRCGSSKPKERHACVDCGARAKPAKGRP